MFYRFTDVLLNKIISGGICYTPSHKMFVSHRSVSLKAEDYTGVAGKVKM